MSKKTEAVEVVFSFDRTGSMYPCISQVRNEVVKTTTRLFDEIPDLRVGIIAHGDYCDGKGDQVIKILDLTDDRKKVVEFVKKVDAAGGGDAPECYELVLHKARSLTWSAGKSKTLVVIGDEVPHSPQEAKRQGGVEIDWRNELKNLTTMGVNVYGVQALNNRHAEPFYGEIAKTTGGFHLRLGQFSQVNDLLMAVAYRQSSPEQLEKFEKELRKDNKVTRGLARALAILSGRGEATVEAEFGKTDLHAVPDGRFQMMHIPHDCSIADFVRGEGIVFKKGRGFYEFTKKVKVQSYKEVVLMNKKTGDMFNGDKAREIAGIPLGVDANVEPTALVDWTCFIQSTSANRKLIGGTKFLYEVPET